MKIVKYILGQMTPRFSEGRLLVVYDPAGRFKPVAQELAERQKADFLDATTHLLRALKRTQFAIQEGLKKGVVLYAPYKAPETDTEKTQDLFAAFGEIGARFPSVAADDYLQICLNALPNKETAVRALFDQCQNREKGPEFEVIEQLFSDQKVQWPNLRSQSGKSSQAEILKWLMLCSESTLKEIAAKASGEALDFVQKIFGPVVCSANALENGTFVSRIWSAVLMTEFMAVRPKEDTSVFDAVPVALPDERQQVLEVIQDLRNDRSAKETYVQQAKVVAAKMDIQHQLARIRPDATRCTFEDEARALRKSLLSSLAESAQVDVHSYAERLSASIWMQEDGVFMDFVRCAVEFTFAMDRLQEQTAGGAFSRSMQQVIADYSMLGATVDGLARRFACQCDMLQEDASTTAEELEAIAAFRARVLKRYRDLVRAEHDRFLLAIAEEGWPVSGLQCNDRVFDDVVQPILQQGGRVAFIVVDALRYELASTLFENLSGFDAELQPACALLPTITAVGKASLLPGAAKLSLDAKLAENKIIPQLNSQAVVSPEDRMKVFAGLFGDRFKHMTAGDFLKKRLTAFEKIDLLCLRYDDIDKYLTGGMLEFPSQAVPYLGRVIRRLADIKSPFTDIVVATDHGFALNLDAGPGDRCEKPAGTWVETHDRFLMGEGEPDAFNCVFPAGHLGIKTNAKHVAFPRALCAYRSGERFFHGGVSLPEAVVPVLTIRLNKRKPTEDVNMPKLHLVPRKPKFTTLIVRVTLMVDPGLLASPDTEHHVQIGIYKQGTKEPAGVVLNNDSGLLTVFNEDVPFSIRLNTFEESTRTISVVALDSQTGKKLADTKFEVEITQ